ncbi:MAG: hypothetical protein E6Q90_10505 [Actinobacteria bacterium]|nr:MAG: hypothetical protein E6Q90_10505 [Actinomycetota bacterium]
MIYLAAAIVVGTLVAMASGRVPPAFALACGLAVAGIAGIATPSQLFSGFSNGGVITVAAMLVIAKGVIYTGVVSRVTWRLLSTVKTATQTLLRLIVPVGVVSALINTTPIVAMLIPAFKELQQTRGIPARQTLLPMAHATTLAGSTTLIGTSSNLLIAGIAAGAGVSVGMFSFALVALPVCIVGWVVLLILAPRVFKAGEDEETPEMDWRVEIPVAPNANGVGRIAADLGIESTQQYRLLNIRRKRKMLEPDWPLAPGDTLVFEATEEGVTALWSSPRFGLSAQHLYAASISTGEHGTLRELEADTDVTVIAAQSDELLGDTMAEPGETIYVTCESTAALAEHMEISLWQDAAGKAPQTTRTRWALLILLAVIISASFGLVPVEIAAFTGALLMVITKVLTPRSAARALDLNTLAILAGSVGLGAVVVQSGIADKISDAVTALSGDSIVGVVVVIAVATTILTNITTNAAAASILTPVALGIASTLSLNPIMLLAIVGTCISFTFINPFSHQSNLMVMQPGGYTMGQFVRFGIPLVAVVLVTVCVVGVLVL